jgi:DNA-binding MarR family transcriptional regulator
VTPARLTALSVLVYGGAATVGDLARRQGVSLPTISRMVDGLVRAGLVDRAEDPRDRRTVRLEVTRRGRELMERGRARRITRLAAELSQLEPSELTALEQGVAALEELEAPAAKRPAPSGRGRKRGTDDDR